MKFAVLKHPLRPISDADLQFQWDLASRIRDKVNEANNAVIRIRRIKTDIAERIKEAPAGGTYTFLHLILPHPPCVLDGDGRYVGPEKGTRFGQALCIDKLVGDPTKAGRFYAGLSGTGAATDGVYISNDFGATWARVVDANLQANLNAGEDRVEVVAAAPSVVAVGVNCCPPGDVLDAVRLAVETTARPVVAYPNSGEDWDGASRRWAGAAAYDVSLAPHWVRAGAAYVGGCCRVGPKDVAALVAVLTPDEQATPN